MITDLIDDVSILRADKRRQLNNALKIDWGQYFTDRCLAGLACCRADHLHAAVAGIDRTTTFMQTGALPLAMSGQLEARESRSQGVSKLAPLSDNHRRQFFWRMEWPMSPS